MTQYLIRSIEHNGETFTDVITVRDNERYQVVEAESKAQALNNTEDSNSRYGDFEILSIFIVASGAALSGIFYTFKFLL